MTSRTTRNTVLGAVGAAIALTIALAACGGGSGAGASGSGGGSSQDNNLTVSISQNVADELPFWIADEAGLFKAEGLNVKLTNLSSSDGFPALVSGQTQLASIGASEMVAGAASGAKVKYLATLTPVFPFTMWAKVSDAQQLKGKRVGVTSTSGSLYIATLAALKQLGLSPTDVQLVTLGSVTNVNNALVAGTIDAAMSHPPATTKIKAAGLHQLVDLSTQNIPTSDVGVAATAAYASSHRQQITKFMSALLKAIQREKSDEAYSEKILSEQLKVTDPQALKETWQYYSQGLLPDVPTPTVAQLQTSKDVLRATNAAVSKLDVSTLVDPSFVNAAK
jgi:NitT/TauT family transport system substrate-binding protein